MNPTTTRSEESITRRGKKYVRHFQKCTLTYFCVNPNSVLSSLAILNETSSSCSDVRFHSHLTPFSKLIHSSHTASSLPSTPPRSSSSPVHRLQPRILRLVVVLSLRRVFKRWVSHFKIKERTAEGSVN